MFIELHALCTRAVTNCTRWACVYSCSPELLAAVQAWTKTHVATGLQGSNTHPKRLSLGNVHFPLVLRVVVHQESGVEHEVAILECCVPSALFHQSTFLAGLRELESERPSLCHCYWFLCWPTLLLYVLQHFYLCWGGGSVLITYQHIHWSELLRMRKVEVCMWARMSLPVETRPLHVPPLEELAKGSFAYYEWFLTTCENTTGRVWAMSLKA